MPHVAFIIVFGSFWTFRTVEDGWEGKLNCPHCGGPRHMVEQQAVKAFMLYWFRLWTLEEAGRLLLCTDCGRRWELPPELSAERPLHRAESRPSPA